MLGDPFDPTADYDLDLHPAVRVSKRGADYSLANTSGLSDAAAVEALKVEFTDKLAILEAVAPTEEP